MPNTASGGRLVQDSLGNIIQGFSPDPAKVQAVQALRAGTKWGQTVTGWIAIAFRATGDVTMYLNTETTKTLTFDSDQIHVIVINSAITNVHFKNNGSATISLEVWGM